jgi:ABC-2 type transport system ATP-binding protein
MGEAVRVTDLVKNYGSLEAVRGISFEIPAGECFGLLGPNGAGKTTTVEILEGLLAATSGEVIVLGRRLDGHDREIRELIGVCLQQTALSAKLEVHETLELFRSFYRTGRSAEGVIAEVGLGDKAHARVGVLSGGQKQRLAVACALVGDPELLFLDEPTTGLDPQSRRQVWEIVNAFKARGRTVLLTTHYMDEAERLCDRVAVMNQGRIIASGTPRELIHSLGGDHVIEIAVESQTPGTVSPEQLANLPGVRAVHADAGLWTLTVTEPHVALPPLLDCIQTAGVHLSRLATRHASLEDVFVSLAGRHLSDD